MAERRVRINRRRVFSRCPVLCFPANYLLFLAQIPAGPFRNIRNSWPCVSPRPVRRAGHGIGAQRGDHNSRSSNKLSGPRRKYRFRTVPGCRTTCIPRRISNNVASMPCEYCIFSPDFGQRLLGIHFEGSATTASFCSQEVCSSTKVAVSSRDSPSRQDCAWRRNSSRSKSFNPCGSKR